MPTVTKSTDVIGWQGLILPYDERSPVGDGRVVSRSTIDPPFRSLPLPLKIQEHSAPGHDQARQGLAKITRVWSTPEGLHAAGTIDTDDPDGAALARKIAGGYAGWISADIETDGGTMVRNRDGSRTPTYRTWRLTGATLVGDPAFEAARITAVTDPDDVRPVESDQGVRFSLDHVLSFASGARRETFTVIGDVNLPWAPREHAWDGPGAARRVQSWADGDAERMSRAFLWRDPDADPTTQAAYSLGFADVIGGELRAVYRGVAAAAGRLGQTSISPEDRERVQSRINTLYDHAAKSFDDPSLKESEKMAEDTPPVPEPAPEEPDTDDEDTQENKVSDADVTRIAEATAEAVVAAIVARETEAQAEFERQSADQERQANVMKILGGE